MLNRGRSVGENELRQRLDLGAPLSRVLIPLSLGLTRRALLRSGVASAYRRLVGVNTHYFAREGAAAGNLGLPVVLVHGIADSALTWSFVLRALASVGPVYALDLPGYGQSGHLPGRQYASIAEQTAVVEAFVREVVGRPALVVGNSMGGWIAARLALAAPDAVRGIVLLDPGGALLEGVRSWEAFVNTVAVRDLQAVRSIYRQMFGRVPLALYMAQHSFRELFARESVRAFIAASIAAAEAEDLAATGFFAAEELRQISVPAALVWGDRDTFLPDGSFEFFRDNLRDATVHRLRGCGHLPQREAPRAMVRIVRTFAAKLC